MADNVVRENAIHIRDICVIRGFLRLIALLVYLLPATATAQTNLDWQACVREAARSNPDLFVAREKIRQVEANRTITRSGSGVQISGSAGAGVSKSDGADRSDSYSYGASASRLLFNGGKASYENSQADEQLTASQFSYESSSSDLRQSLRGAFVSLLKSQDQVLISQGILERRDQSAKLIKLGYEAGREHKGSLLTAEAKYAQAQADLARARRNVGTAQAELARQIGWSNSTEVVVVGALETGNAEENEPDFGKLVQNVPYLKYLAVQTYISRLGVSAARADFFPRISAGADIGQSGGNWPPDSGKWGAGVSLSLPIFEGGSRVAQMRKAISERLSAEADERSGRDELTVNLRAAWVGLRNAIDNVVVSRKFLEAAKERAKIAEAQYSTGLLSFDNWIIIEDDYASSEKNFLDAKAQASTAEANWIHAKGGTLENEIN